MYLDHSKPATQEQKKELVRLVNDEKFLENMVESIKDIQSILSIAKNSKSDKMVNAIFISHYKKNIFGVIEAAICNGNISKKKYDQLFYKSIQHSSNVRNPNRIYGIKFPEENKNLTYSNWLLAAYLGSKEVKENIIHNHPFCDNAAIQKAILIEEIFDENIVKSINEFYYSNSQDENNNPISNVDLDSSAISTLSATHFNKPISMGLFRLGSLCEDLQVYFFKNNAYNRYIKVNMTDDEYYHQIYDRDTIAPIIQESISNIVLRDPALSLNNHAVILEKIIKNKSILPSVKLQIIEKIIAPRYRKKKKFESQHLFDIVERNYIWKYLCKRMYLDEKTKNEIIEKYFKKEFSLKMRDIRDMLFAGEIVSSANQKNYVTDDESFNLAVDNLIHHERGDFSHKVIEYVVAEKCNENRMGDILRSYLFYSENDNTTIKEDDIKLMESLSKAIVKLYRFDFITQMISSMSQTHVKRSYYRLFHKILSNIELKDSNAANIIQEIIKNNHSFYKNYTKINTLLLEP
jgi:hypothetical protein